MAVASKNYVQRSDLHILASLVLFSSINLKLFELDTREMPPLVSSSYTTRLVAPQKWLSTRGLQFSVPIFSCLVANRVPLAQVVEDCVRRWFQDTLKEAKSGDVGMQVLVGQMYSSCYGIPKDEHKVL
ncbi:hypothetical protein Bca4012_000242 [Brassica carinata]|uniref:Uncharacterized protein n=2 Tax=Brassica TaxID=3705 RepID=A0A8X7WRQ8_BRACI|nr:hypothetical protein Bca52824_005946 [Brassica carinata]